MSIKVVDLQDEEATKEEQPALEAIEETKEEATEPEPVVDTTNEIIEETARGALNPFGVETAEPPKEEVKEVKKPVRAQDKMVRCPKCQKEMKLKSFRYGHEQNCKGTLEQKPVKPHAKPKAKQTPKPKPQPQQVYYSDKEDDEVIREATSEQRVPLKPKLSAPVRNQILKPQQHISPETALYQHYQLLQQTLMKQKQDKYNNLCANMFSTKSKKDDYNF